MGSALVSLVLVVAVLGALLVIVGSVSTSKVYEEIGKGGLIAERDNEREADLREMLQARSDRKVRAGGEPLDLDAEVQRLMQAAPEDQV